MHRRLDDAGEGVPPRHQAFCARVRADDLGARYGQAKTERQSQEASFIKEVFHQIRGRQEEAIAPPKALAVPREHAQPVVTLVEECRFGAFRPGHRHQGIDRAFQILRVGKWKHAPAIARARRGRLRVGRGQGDGHPHLPQWSNQVDIAQHERRLQC